MFPNPHDRVIFPNLGGTADFRSRGESGSGVVLPLLGGLVPFRRAQFDPAGANPPT